MVDAPLVTPSSRVAMLGCAFQGAAKLWNSAGITRRGDFLY